MIIMKILKASCGTGSAPRFRVPLRKSGYYIPPSQYDTPFPNRLKPGYVMSVYWETIPLFTVTAICVGFVFGAVVWACRNKVDVVFKARSRENLSRTMDLRYPTCHKMIVIHQRYEPWPEMYKVLKMLKYAEKNVRLRVGYCQEPQHSN